MSLSERASAGRKPSRCEKVSDIPIMNTKNGKTRSVGVQPCHGWCSSGHQVLAWSPELLTRIIAAIVAPRNTSSESRRSAGTLSLMAVNRSAYTPQMRFAIAVFFIATLASAEDWPRFRGPQGSGTSDSTGLPAEFGPGKNLVWRVAVPRGRSSPIVVKDRVYLTALDGETLVTLALDRNTGATAWRREIRRDHAHKVYVGNDTATPTLASDGQSLYAFFPDLGLVSFDLAGKERWRLPLGPFDSFYGISSSPVVLGDTVALVVDQPRGAFVLAVDKDTGRVRWRTERKQVTSEGFSTPTFYAPERGKPQLIATGAYRVDAYDLETGENLWWIGKPGRLPGRLAGDLRRHADRGEPRERGSGVSAVRRPPEPARHEQGWAALGRGVESRRRLQGPLRLGGHGQGRLRHPRRVRCEAEGERHRLRSHRQHARRQRRPHRFQPGLALQEIVFVL